MTADVVVIGAGVAGLSAAVRLARAGRRVVVFEEAPRLGGRATSFVDKTSGERVDNGQHVLFGCYRATYEYLRDIGTAHLAPLQPHLRLRMANDRGEHAVLQCPPIRAPFHLLAGVLQWPALRLSDRFRVLRLATVLREVQRDGAAAVAARVAGDSTVAAWLAQQGQSQRLRDWLWDPLSIAALNQQPDVAAAQPFVRVLGELFAPDPSAAAIGLPAVPLDELFAARARDAIESRGGTVLLRHSARVQVDPAGASHTVRAADRVVAASCVISAVAWHGFGRLFAEQPPPELRAIIDASERMTSSPIVTVNLWLDGPVLPEPFIGLVGGPMHWVFDKAAIFGSHAGHLSVVSSGAVELATLTNEEITHAAMVQLRRAIPEIGRRRLLRSVVVREHRATFSLAPGAPPRPATVTPIPGFFLAGDWTDTSLPATIEGAVLSGFRAADAVLARR